MSEFFHLFLRICIWIITTWFRWFTSAGLNERLKAYDLENLTFSSPFQINRLVIFNCILLWLGLLRNIKLCDQKTFLCSFWNVFVEWVESPSKHRILKDEDSTSVKEGDWKKINTLLHYEIPDGTCLRLVKRFASPFDTSGKNGIM